MARIVTVEQMRTIESEADRRGVSYDRMMDRAGEAVFAGVIGRYGPASGRRVAILCGEGNNGGDGLVAALHFTRAGAAVTVILAARRKDGDARLRSAIEAGCAVEDAVEETGRASVLGTVRAADILIDAVLGTGTTLPLRPPVADILADVSRLITRSERRPFVAAVDCPSGVECNSGQAAPESIPADLTVTLGAAKPGLLLFPAAEFTGSLIVADIGLPQDLPSLDVPGPQLADPDLVRDWLPRRPRDSHKGTFGRVIVIGGSVNYPGAPTLAGLGAYRAGAGLVTLAVPRPVYPAAVSLLPEATWIVLPDDLGVIAAGAMEALEPELANAQALVIGPGFGREKPTASFLKSYFLQETGKKTSIGFGAMEKREGARKTVRPPTVIDADALRLLADDPGWTGMIPPGSVLTPHPGEMSALTGWTKERIQNNRPGAAQRFAREWNAVVVLKGAFTVVAAPDGRCAISPFATPALARAGTGDVLAGTIGGLIAQGVDGWRASVLGTCLHGRAGELAAVHEGVPDSVLARDVARFLAAAIAELR
jgi:hydroxyethylthiazole kinase-like uncharacterized protein yjeF